MNFSITECTMSYVHVKMAVLTPLFHILQATESYFWHNAYKIYYLNEES